MRRKLSGHYRSSPSLSKVFLPAGIMPHLGSEMVRAIYASTPPSMVSISTPNAVVATPQSTAMGLTAAFMNAWSAVTEVRPLLFEVRSAAGKPLRFAREYENRVVIFLDVTYPTTSRDLAHLLEQYPSRYRI